MKKIIKILLLIIIQIVLFHHRIGDIFKEPFQVLFYDSQRPLYLWHNAIVITKIELKQMFKAQLRFSSPKQNLYNIIVTKAIICCAVLLEISMYR